MRRNDSRTDVIALALLALAGVLLLANLQNGYLWQDEAETAMLARRVLEFGYPRGTDGRNAIDIAPFGYGAGQAWVYAPWLPFYLLAGAFALFGQSTAVARLPFALFGWLSIWLAWRLACRLTDDRRIHRLTVALLACSVPFLLHMRQCRYYAPTTALVLGLCLAYLGYLRRPSRGTALGLGFLVTLLFHTNFGTCLPTAGALILHQMRWGTPPSRRRGVAALALAAALTVPWAVYFYRSAFVGAPTLARIWQHFQYYVRVTNKYLAPLAAMALLSLGSRLMSRRRWAVPAWQRLPREIQALFVALVAAHALFLLVPDQRHLRYLIPLAPLMALGTAMWAAALMDRHRLAGRLVVVLLVLTSVLSSGRPSVPLLEFAGELTHRYTGPMEGVVDYLRRHARPGEIVKIPYDDRTVMFYTGLTVESPSAFLQETYPEWIVIRRDWLPGAFFDSAYFQRIQARYERIELEAPDVLWQNREDPGSHHFRTVQGAPRVVMYRRLLL